MMNNDEQTQQHVNNLKSVFAMEGIKQQIMKPFSVSNDEEYITAFWHTPNKNYGIFMIMKDEENNYKQVKLKTYNNDGFITFVSPVYTDDTLDINTIRGLFTDAISKINDIQNNTQTINLTSADKNCTLTRHNY